MPGSGGSSGIGGSGGAEDSGSSAWSGVGGSGGASTTQDTRPTATTEHLTIGAHDPSMIYADTHWYLFTSGGTLSVRRSSDMDTYSNAGSVFSSVPAWITASLGNTIPDLWAPDVSYFNDRYHVYYAGSTFGSNRSVIGLATNAALDAADPRYQWKDEGLVIESNGPGSSDDWNAVDPSLVFDADEHAWLTFGSFWSGIKLRRIDPATGKLSTVNTVLYSLAARTNGAGIEAPSIVYHNGFYYLFVSFDACCNGVGSTYRTMAGRSRSVTGPYVDRSGRLMLQGYAEQMLITNGRYIGPGGGTAFRSGDYYYYAYHYYDGLANGIPLLEVRPISFSSDDWPVFGDPYWN